MKHSDLNKFNSIHKKIQTSKAITSRQATMSNNNNNNDNNLFFIKLKDLFQNHLSGEILNKNNTTYIDNSKIGNRNEIINDIYAQIDKNLNDNRIQFVYLPKANFTLTKLFELNDQENSEYSFSQYLHGNFINSATSITQKTQGKTALDAKLAPMEIALIFFIVFLWLLSVFCCLKRYSLLLCFRKRDSVPYYNENLTKFNLETVNEQTMPLNGNNYNININFNNNSDNNILDNNNNELTNVINASNTNSNSINNNNNINSTNIDSNNANINNISVEIEPAKRLYRNTDNLSFKSSFLNKTSEASNLNLNRITKHTSLQTITNILMKQHYQQQQQQFQQQYSKYLNEINYFPSSKHYYYFNNISLSNLRNYRNNNNMTSKYSLDFLNNQRNNQTSLNNNINNSNNDNNNKQISIANDTSTINSTMINENPSRLNSVNLSTYDNKYPINYNIDIDDNVDYLNEDTLKPMNSRKSTIKDKRHIFNNYGNNGEPGLNKHFNLLSLDETALKYYNNKLTKLQQQQQLLSRPLSRLKQSNSPNDNDSASPNIALAPHSIQSDSSSYIPDFVSYDDNSSLYEISLAAKKQAKYLKTQKSLSPNYRQYSYEQHSSNFSSFNKSNQQLTTSSSGNTNVNNNNNSNNATALNNITNVNNNNNTSNINQINIKSNNNNYPMFSATIDSSLTFANQSTADSISTNRQMNPLSTLRRHMFANSRQAAQRYYAQVNSIGDTSRASSNNNIINNQQGDSLSYTQPPPPTPNSQTSTTSPFSNNNDKINSNNNNEQQSSMVSMCTIYTQPTKSSFTTIPISQNKYNSQLQPLQQVNESPTSSSFLSNNNNSTIAAATDTASSVKTSNNETSNTMNTPATDSNYLNPNWIPQIVRDTLLDLHHRAVISKSDSSIKTKRPNSTAIKDTKRKKPLSLQNTQDQTYSLNINTPAQLEVLVETRKKLTQKSTASKIKSRFFNN